MDYKVRIIKHKDRKQPEVDRPEQPSRNPTREMTNTIKLWVSEFKEKRRTDERNSRIAITSLFTPLESVGKLDFSVEPQ
jgi:hypothetical protein